MFLDSLKWEDPGHEVKNFEPEFFTQEEGIATFVQPESDVFRFKTIQEVRSIFEDNHAARLNDDENWKTSPTFKKVASIPFTLWMKWEKLGITADPEALKKAIELNPEVKTTKRRI